MLIKDRTTRKKSSLFRKLMLYFLLASILMAMLSSVLFFYFGGKRYRKQVLDDLLPRASSIANIMSERFDGIISDHSVNRFVFNTRKDGTLVLIFDEHGNPYQIRENRPFSEPGKFDVDNDNKLNEIVEHVLISGEAYQQTRFDLVVIALPVINGQNQINGVVLLMKMSAELHGAMRSMMLALLASFIIVTVFMISFAYYGSKKITEPILKMESVAIAMQKGDFSEKADDSAENEIGRLGNALNSLSCELSQTISDLNQARNRLNRILNSLVEGVAAFERNELIYANPAIKELLSLPSFPDCIDEIRKIIPNFDLYYKNTVSKGVCERLEFRINEKVLGCSFMKMDPSKEYSDGVILLIRDVTETFRLEQTRREYVANVSHELKTPITSIRSMAETLNDGMVRSEEEQNKYYGNILRESTRMGRLINELLELSRIQSGAGAFEKEDFSLSDLLTSIIERMTMIAGYSGIGLTLSCDNDVCVFSNRARIEQVCLAIIDNAIKYCSDSGQVEIKVTESDEKAFVAISNDGQIDEIDLPHLFERFYKADKSHSGNGTGLGLAIAKEIIERLGEEITVACENQKVIFTFTVGLIKQD